MDRTLMLLKRAGEGDEQAKKVLAEENLGLVWSVVRRFSNRGYDLEDLFQVGCIGLLKSIDKFDLSFDVKFSTYAVPMIMGELKRFIRDDGMIKVSRSLKETAYRVKNLREHIMNTEGTEPGIEELAKRLQIEKEEIVMALEANQEVDSLHKMIYQSDGNEILLEDKIGSGEDEAEKLVNEMTIDGLMKKLSGNEEKIMRMRYFEDKTQTEIAKAIGISQVQVSRIEKKVLERFRSQL